MKRVIGTIILIIAIICFGWSAFSLGKYAWQAHTPQKNIDQLADRINTDVTEASDDSEEEDPVAESEAMMEKYGDLYNENKDFIGWLSIEGTNINNPVMYTPDDPEHYLRKNFNGDYDIGGMLFVDSRGTFNPSSTDTIIYGHHMKNGTMFHDLMNYKQKSFFDAHRIIDLLWDGVETQWEIFVAYIIKPNTIYHISTAFTDDQHFADVMNQTIEYAKTVKPSNADPDVTIKPSDQVLTLSTCTYEYDDSFFAVMARRIK